MSQQSPNYPQNQSHREYFSSNKNGNQMVRSMITEGYSAQTYTPPSKNLRMFAQTAGQKEIQEVLETSSMILTSRKSRKYSEAAFNQELMKSMNRSKVFESKIVEPLKFADKDPLKSSKIQELNHTIYETLQGTDDKQQEECQLKRSHLVFSSSQLQKSMHTSPRFTFQYSTKSSKESGEGTVKKSVNDFINVRTHQINHNLEDRVQTNLAKFKTPLLKSSNKDSYIFKRQEIGSMSQIMTPAHQSLEKQKELTKDQALSNSNIKDFFKKPSIDSKAETPSPLKKHKELEVKEGSTSHVTPVESLRSSINKLTRQDFHIGKRLGKGKFGEVFLAKHKQIGFLCAMKIISKKVIVSQKIQNQLISEIKIQLFLSHPNIVALYGIFSDKQNIYLLQEPCMEGQLYQKIKKTKRIPEKQASYLIKQVVLAVDYLHSQKIIHRDIKPQNILLSDGIIKICDFGWAAFHNDQFRDTFCGTPLYLSPQLLNHSNYDDKVDNWAIGILAYQILIGRIPFKITTKQELQKILHEQIVFPENIEISDAAKNFILLMLEKNPSKRADLQICLAHPFFS